MKQKIFKRKFKCVLSPKPKFKQGNIVIRPINGSMVAERVVTRGKATRLVPQPWPKTLLLVVRGAEVADDVAGFHLLDALDA